MADGKAGAQFGIKLIGDWGKANEVFADLPARAKTAAGMALRTELGQFSEQAKVRLLDGPAGGILGGTGIRYTSVDAAESGNSVVLEVKLFKRTLSDKQRRALFAKCIAAGIDATSEAPGSDELFLGPVAEAYAKNTTGIEQRILAEFSYMLGGKKLGGKKPRSAGKQLLGAIGKGLRGVKRGARRAARRAAKNGAKLYKTAKKSSLRAVKRSSRLFKKTKKQTVKAGTRLAKKFSRSVSRGAGGALKAGKRTVKATRRSVGRAAKRGAKSAVRAGKKFLATVGLRKRRR